MAAVRKVLPDHYAALEVREDADEAAIKKSYRRLVLQWHPDRNPADRETAEEKIRLLNIAYEIVMNPIKRETYDLQRAALSRKRKGQPSKPRSAERVDIPKEFMMQPVGHPESFVRQLGCRVVVHARSDDPDVDFGSFFGSTKLALWWLPEVNNMCRIRALGSKARGDKKAAAAGRAGGLNLVFDPNKVKTAGAEGSELRMAPANKGQKTDSVDFVTKPSPTCEGGLRFESASQRGMYLAFFPPTHLRVVNFLEEAEDRVLDFTFVDFSSMFKFITLEEVLAPVVGVEQVGEWLPLEKFREDEHVKEHFQKVMGKPVWDEEDFQAYFEGHWTTWEYDSLEKRVRLRPKNERLAKQLRALPKAGDVIAAVAKSEEAELKSLPVGALARALAALAAGGNKEETKEESTAAQIRLLAALRAVGTGENEQCDVPSLELLGAAEQVLELGGDDPDDTVLVQRSAGSRILAGKSLRAAANSEGGLQGAGFALRDLDRLLALPGAAGRDVLLASACVGLLGEGSSVEHLREMLRTAVVRGSTSTAAAIGTAVMKALANRFSPTGEVAASDDTVDTVKEVAELGVRLPAAAAMLRKLAGSATPVKLAEALLVLSQKCGPGQADDLQHAAASLASKGSLEGLRHELLLQLALEASKAAALAPVVEQVAMTATSAFRLLPSGEVVKFVLALARRRGQLSTQACRALQEGVQAELIPFLSNLSADDLGGLVLATLGFGWTSLLEATCEHLIERLPRAMPPKALLLVTPALLKARPDDAKRLIGAWPKVLKHCDASAAPTSKDAGCTNATAEGGLSPDQLVKLAHSDPG
eukprot:TRINITY_DN89102_c0_g1_i1.p1 TRINITY_DN89102_c0_g1~~TRINITY_DN89102_c0_g1_i1.p1  ORF type:complete len:817 (+),score=187.59 TRINITY_DN89102_c0_g1_i1:31-2481(+)